MQKEDKEQIVAELTERLRTAETLIVADYRGLTMPQIDKLRGQLLEHGARFRVVKNTLTRRAAEAAGADAVLALLDGPSAIAFVDSDGDAVAVAKALAESARETKVLAVRGGVMAGKSITSADVEALSTLPPLEVLRGQVIGAVIAPLNQLLALVNAPLQNLYELIDARIEQLGNEPSAVPLEDADSTGSASGEVAPDTAPGVDAEGSDDTTTSRAGEAGEEKEE